MRVNGDFLVRTLTVLSLLNNHLCPVCVAGVLFGVEPILGALVLVLDLVL